MRLLTLLLLPTATLSCIHYAATFPFSETLPFEATITDNNLTTCWLSRTYAEHNALQILANLAPPTRNELQNPDEVTWGFKRWDFECLEGYEGWANVGVRTMGYRRRGEQKVVGWVADVREDIWGERWEYWKSFECEIKTEEVNKRTDGEEGKGDFKGRDETKGKENEDAKKDDLKVKEENRKREEEKKKEDKKAKEAKKKEDLKKKLEQRNKDQKKWEEEMLKME
jgi:hypothetical protein